VSGDLFDDVLIFISSVTEQVKPVPPLSPRVLALRYEESSMSVSQTHRQSNVYAHPWQRRLEQHLPRHIPQQAPDAASRVLSDKQVTLPMANCSRLL
jgi:hypothetical protein